MSSSIDKCAFAALPGAGRRHTPAGAYWRAGTGKRRIVLLNAFGLSLDLFAPLAEALAERATLVAPDLGAREGDAARIGASYYAGPAHEERFLALAEAIAAEEGAEQLSALSWCSGAKYALALAAAAPVLVDSLVLLTPSFAGKTPDAEDSAFEKSLLTMCKVVASQPGSAPGMARSMLALLDKSAGAAPPPWLDHVKKPFTAAPCMIDYAEQLLNFRAHDVTGRLGAVTQPVLLVTAAKDGTTSPARARRLCAGLPGAAGWEVGEGDHYLLYERPGMLAAKIEAFLNEGLPPSLSDEAGAETFRSQPAVMETGEI